MFFAIPSPSLTALVGGLKDDALFDELRQAGHLVIGNSVSEVLSKTALRSDPIHPNDAGYQKLAEIAHQWLQAC